MQNVCTCTNRRVNQSAQTWWGHEGSSNIWLRFFASENIENPTLNNSPGSTTADGNGVSVIFLKIQSLEDQISDMYCRWPSGLSWATTSCLTWILWCFHCPRLAVSTTYYHFCHASHFVVDFSLKHQHITFLMPSFSCLSSINLHFLAVFYVKADFMFTRILKKCSTNEVAKKYATMSHL